MDKITKKRMPKILYTSEEEDWLVINVLEHSSVIENRRTDGPSNREKESAWDKITTAFNFAPPGQERTQKSLREKYSKIKQTLKDRAFCYSKDTKKTGGGSSKRELSALSEPMKQLTVLLMPSQLGVAAITEDSDHSTTNQLALQYDRREKASSSDPLRVISMEKLFVDDEDKANVSDHPYSSSEALITAEGTVVERTREKVTPVKLHSRRRKRESEKIASLGKTPEFLAEKQKQSAKKYKIQIEILEGEKERYKLETERAAIDLKRAAIECERAEIDRERSSIELQRAKNQLDQDKEFHRLRLLNLQQTSGNTPHSVSPVPTLTPKIEYD